MTDKLTCTWESVVAAAYDLAVNGRIRVVVYQDGPDTYKYTPAGTGYFPSSDKPLMCVITKENGIEFIRQPTQDVKTLIGE